MDVIRQLVRKVLFRIGQLEMIFAATILIGIVLMISAQVLLNAGLGRPITYEQEAGAYALVWLTFVGASIALKQMRHVTIVSFVGKLPYRLTHFVRAIVFALVLWTLYTLIRELLPIIAIEGRSTTVALPIDLPRSYFFSVPLIISCSLMASTSALFFIEAALGTLSREADATLISPIKADTP